MVFGLGSIHAPSGQRSHLLDGEAVKVGHVAHQAALKKRGDELLPHHLDVHDRAAHPMQQSLGSLRGAVDGDAAIRHLVALVHDGAAAARAVGRHLEQRGIGRTKAEDRAHDLGNDVAGLVDHHSVTDTHVLAANLVDVVQRGTSDGGPGHHDGVELGDRGENAGAPHLHGDVAQDGLALLGRELERREEARGTGREAQGVLIGKGINLHHDAVDVIGQAVALAEGLRTELVHLGGTVAALEVGVHREACHALPSEEVPLAVDVDRVHVGKGVHEGGQVAYGRDLGVLLAKGAGGGVARVGKGGTACLVVLLVEAHERLFGHKDLAAHLDRTVGCAHMRQGLVRQACGHVLDGAHVERDVLAHDAVAARCRAHEHAVLVRKGDAQAVYLKLAHIGGGDAQLALGTLEPLVELVEVHDVVD